MPISEAGGSKIFYELAGSRGEKLVFVHGSWVDHANWDQLVPLFSPQFRVLTYDRRGHSGSERLAKQGSVTEDVSDLLALVEEQGWVPAHFIGNSFGGSIVLKLAASRPDLFKSLSVHEPPLFSLVDSAVLTEIVPRVNTVLDLIRSGDMQNAAWNFVENVAIGPGGWDTLTPEMRASMIFNAPTFLDEQQDPNWLTMDLDALAGFSQPVLLTQGDQSPPFFGTIVKKLAAAIRHARVETIRDCGHIPQITHPEQYAALIRNFVASRWTPQ